jgi:hypothetical protein
VASGDVTRGLLTIASGSAWALMCHVLRRGSYVQKTVEDLTKGRQFPDPDKERQRTTMAIRFVLLCGIASAW